MKKLLALPFLLLPSIIQAQDYEYRYNRFGYEYRYDNRTVKERADDIRERWKLEDEKEARRQARLQKIRESRKAHSSDETKHFIYKDKDYGSFEGFKKSDAYAELKAEVEFRQLARQYEQRLADERRQRAVEFEAHRRLHIQSYPDLFRQEDARTQYLARRSMGEWWWKKFKHPELYDQSAPSYAVLDKIAKKHNCSHAEAWENYPEEISIELEKLLPPGSYKPYQVLSKK